MIRGMYIRAGRLAYYLTLPALYVVSMWARSRVRVIVINEKNEILLVRNWFGSQEWSLPGGGRRWGEPAIKAAVREIKEELAIELHTSGLQPAGALERYDNKTPYSAKLFVAHVPLATPIVRQAAELFDHGWFAENALPKSLHPSVRRAMKLRRKQRESNNIVI